MAKHVFFKLRPQKAAFKGKSLKNTLMIHI